MAWWHFSRAAASRTDVPLVYEAMPEGDLVGRKLGRPAEADASFFGGFAPGAGPLMDERALEFRDTGEHRQDHPARRRGSVGPGLGE